MTYPYRFKIKAWEEDERKYYYSTGLGLCKSYTDAMQQLETTFADSLCTVEFLELYADENMIFLPEEVCEQYSKTDFPIIDFSKEAKAND